MRPLIGITADRFNSTGERSEYPFKYGQSHTYSDAIFQAGGVPVILPMASSLREARELTEAVDGILFAGGSDINPRLYGQEITGARGINTARDEHELRLMDCAYELLLPTLAICRGMQLLNVHRGGTLHQDILSDVPGAMDHDGHAPQLGMDRLIHEIHIDQKSKLAKILGSTAMRANSFHHQAVDTPGKNLVASAWSDDGIVEAIESSDKAFVIGVQSHPEALVDTVEPSWRALFTSFVAAALKSQSLRF